jgi:adenine-specific DNA methylase
MSLDSIWNKGNMIENDFDVPFVSAMALREKQIQQNYRPIIGVHKWFARRPGSLFRSLIISEFGTGPISEVYFESQDFRGISIGDPFMGGGTPLLKANRMGCDVIGVDINPMFYWIVREEISEIDLTAYQNAASELLQELEVRIGEYYTTDCTYCESKAVRVKYFLWVKVIPCGGCGHEVNLFPGHLISQDKRHPTNVFVCGSCGELKECPDRKAPGNCETCFTHLQSRGPAFRNKCRCPECGYNNRYPNAEAGAPSHRMFAIEYHCPDCSVSRRGRLFKKPSAVDLKKYDRAREEFDGMDVKFVPEDRIPNGDETNRLHRWGYKRYREMFNNRRLLGLEISCQRIALTSDSRIKNALATNLSDLLRYQNMLCRYDTMALKSLDIFSIHGYPIGLVQCESNILGTRSTNVAGGNSGSGGWSNIIDKYLRAKRYCEIPFEIKLTKQKIDIPGEKIGEHGPDLSITPKRSIELFCENAAEMHWRQDSLDGVFTDPPYYANVQYAELIDFCYVWLRRIVGESEPTFKNTTTRNASEFTGNHTMNRGLEQSTKGLSGVFVETARALKTGSPFVFTYHHRTMEAYYPITVAMLDAGLTCSASLPCPGEMGGSIHISGTNSSIIDTVFVCRTSGTTSRKLIVESPAEIAHIVESDVETLRSGGVQVTRGDLRCIILGHLTRLAIWALKDSWHRQSHVETKLRIVGEKLGSHEILEQIERLFDGNSDLVKYNDSRGLKERFAIYAGNDGQISF